MLKLNRTGNALNRNTRNNDNENWAKLEKKYNNVVGEITEEVFDKIVDGSKIDWSQMVDTVADLPSGAKIGETRGVKEDNKIYRFDGSDWIPIAEINLNPIAEVDDRLSSKLTETDDSLFYVSRGNRDGLNPSFVIVDDDGKEEVLSVLKPLLDSYGVKFTSAIITGRVNTSGYLTEHDIIELYNDGVDIVSHTKTHPNLRPLSNEELDVELGESKSYLENLGIPIKHLMYPYGTVNDKVIRKTKEYYDSACGTSSGINTHPIMTYHLRRLAVGSYSPIGDKLEDFIPYIDEAIQENALCVFMTHIEETPQAGISLLTQVIEYVQSKGYDFETYSEAYEKHKNALEQGLYTTSYQNKYNVVGADGSYISKDIAIYTTDYDAYNYNNIPDDFRDRARTITLIRDNNSSGFPLNRGGVLTTDRLSTDDVFTQQIYEPRGSGKEYIRYWDNGEWTEFIDKTGIEVIPSNTVDFSTKLNSFPQFKVSTTYINDRNASGFPDDLGGVLTTYNLTSDGTGAYQEWKVRGEYLKYSRHWNVSTGEWRTFRLISTMNFSAATVTISTPITSFPLFGVSVNRVTNTNADGFPNNKGGILKTYRLDDYGDFCYQEFKPYNSNRLHIRSWEPTNEKWNEFTLIGGVGSSEL